MHIYCVRRCDPYADSARHNLPMRFARSLCAYLIVGEQLEGSYLGALHTLKHCCEEDSLYASLTQMEIDGDMYETFIRGYNKRFLKRKHTDKAALFAVLIWLHHRQLFTDAAIKTCATDLHLFPWRRWRNSTDISSDTFLYRDRLRAGKRLFHNVFKQAIDHVVPIHERQAFKMKCKLNDWEREYTLPQCDLAIAETTGARLI